MAYSWWVVCWREGWKRIQSHAMLLLVCVPCQQTKAWCEGWFFRNHVSFKCFFWSPNWRSCNLWKGHLKPTKRVTWKNSAPKTPTRNLKMPTWKTEKPTNIESIQHEISFGETPKPFIFFLGGGLKFDGNYIYNMWYIRKIYVHTWWTSTFGPGGDFNSTNKKKPQRRWRKTGEDFDTHQIHWLGTCTGGTENGCTLEVFS